MDMQDDWMARENYGKAAMKTLEPVPPNFRIFKMERLGVELPESTGIRITGAEFQVATSGPELGLLSVMVEGSERTVRVTTEEIKACAH